MSVLSSSPINRPPKRRTPGVAESTQQIPYKATWLDRWSRRAVLSMLRRLTHGQLVLTEQQVPMQFGQATANEVVEIEVLDPRFYREIALGSSLGAGDAYVKGYWQADDLLAVMRMFAKNLTQENDLNTWALPLQAIGRTLLRWSTRNSRSGSRKNIQRHYDLSNELFALFLDPTMTYSCGVFPSEDATLEAASLEKYERICRKIQLNADDHLLEIGCGWGGFAEYAAYNYGCRVTGITISEEQLEFAQQRINRAGLRDQVDLRLCDYRDVQGTYNKLVSIEMIEAVGHEFHDQFFEKCCTVLRPDGSMLLQAITIPDDRYDYYRRSVDFIQKHIFPGGCLPSLGRISDVVSRTTDLRITGLDDFAADYARTLQTWRDKFFVATDELERLGFDDAFRRTWDYYFCYCAAGFLERQIGVAQILLKRPGAE